MEIKTQKQTTVILSLTETEAEQLRSVMAAFPRGHVAITDVIFDALDSVDVDGDDETQEAALKSMEERYL